MASQSLISAVNSYDNYIQRKGIDEQVIDAYIEACRVAINGEKDITYGLQITNRSKGIIERFCMDRTGGRILDLEKYSQQHEEKYSLVDDYYKTLLIEAHYRFESFMLYMEKNRPVEERFYQPRINPLRQVAQLIQDLYDDVLDEGMVFCPGRIGKTQIVKMGNLWFGSNRPERSNLYSAYSDKITGGYYDGIIEMITDPTYTYAEIYPNIVEKKLVTDGKDLTVDLIRKKTYPTFTMRSIYGTLNGACDCDGLGVYDDLFSGIDEALSEDRQNTVWGKFDNNFMPRIKPGKAKLLGIGTRWAKKDVQGRRLDLLQNDPEYKGIRHREVIIPALNENGESNFDYPYHLGYTTLDYKRRMASFENNDDMASWFAQYQQEPIERNENRFAEFFLRCLADIGTCCGNYEQETAEMMEKAFSESKTYDPDRVLHQLEERTAFLKDCTKYGNKTKEQQSKSYDTMMMYEVKDLVDDLLEIVKAGGADDTH